MFYRQARGFFRNILPCLTSPPTYQSQRNGSGSTAHAPADDPICCAEPSRPALPGLGCRWNYMGGSKVMGDPQMDGL